MSSKRALLIGNSSFRHEELTRLSAPSNDVRAFAELLEDPKIASFDHVDLKLDTSLVDAKKAIGDLFRNRDPDDLLLLYYSGHGLRDTNGTFYLALPETDPADPDPGSIDEHWLRRVIDDSASQRQIVILDCCHSGALIPANMTARDAASSPVLTEKTLDPTGHGRFIMTATTAEASAFEQDGRSLYTRHLVDALKTGGAAPDKEQISVNDLHTFVKRRVAEALPDAMRPQLWVDAQVDPKPLIVARNPKPRRRLDESLVKKLWSESAEQVELAIFRLREIAADQENDLADDARQVLSDRLEAADTLSFANGVRIQNILKPEQRQDVDAKVAQLKVAQLNERISELERELYQEKQLRSQVEAAWQNEQSKIKSRGKKAEKQNAKEQGPNKLKRHKAVSRTRSFETNSSLNIAKPRNDPPDRASKIFLAILIIFLLVSVFA